MKERTRLKLKILSSLMMCILSLFSVITLTLSWFAFNDRTQGNGMNITVEHSLDYLGCEYYQVKSNGAGKYQLNEMETPTLGAYSALSDDYRLVIKIYVYNPNDDQFTVNALTQTTYFMGNTNYPLLPPQKKKTDLPNDSGKNYTNALSSIVSFSVLTENEASAIIEKEENKQLDALPSEDRLVNFIDLTNNTVNSSISLKQAENTAITPVKDTYNGTPCGSICIFITYDPLLVNTVFSANIGNNDMYLLANDKQRYYDIPFVCDFSLLLEKYVGSN